MNRYAYRSDRLFDAVVYAILLIVLVAVGIPFLYVIVSSFATQKEILTRGFFLLPTTGTINAYGFLTASSNFMIAFRNGVWITVCGTVINMLFTCLMAYGLSKSWLQGRRTLNLLVLVTMLFNGGMIPTYLVVSGLGLINSYWSIFLTTAIAPFNLIVLRSFFKSVPAELEESAKIDGCGEWRQLWSIVLPLSMPAIATFTLFYAVHNWNTFFQAILYLNDAKKWPLQVYLRQMLIESSSEMPLAAGRFEYTVGVKMAAVVLTALPLLIVYPFMQKYFDKGMLLGSVKG